MEFSQRILVLLIIPLFLIIPISADADSIKETSEGSMDIEITYPESVVIGRDFSISILVENNGWEDKQDISFSVDNQDNSIQPVSESTIFVEKLSAGGSYGSTLEFSVSPDAQIGPNFLNILYSQVLLRNNEEPQEPSQTNIAIPITIKNQPLVTMHTITPESIFEDAEFPFTVEIISEDEEITDVSLQIIPPKDIEFRGETMHSFSSIQKNSPVSVTAQILTPTTEVVNESKIPFQVKLTYVDEEGEEKTDSQTISLLLRPRTFMELTTDGGIWIGSFFLAPYISIGTIVGIPVGLIFSLLVRRSQNKKKRKKTTKTK